MVRCMHCGTEGELRKGECRACNKRQIHYPTIHLNGTGVKSLLAGYTEAANALRHAQEALSGDAAPNARDYYPQGDVWGMVQAEHVKRLLAVEELLADVEALAVYCMEEDNKRRR